MTDPQQGLSELWRSLEHGREPVCHAAAWRTRLGAEAATALERTGLLVPRGRADWYPCGGAWGRGCPRRVVEGGPDADHPFVAVCGRDEDGCLDLPLAAADLELLGVSLDALIHQLRRALGISGRVHTEEAGFPDARCVGELAGRPVFLARSAGWPGFEAWLAARGRALALVPTARDVPTTVLDRFGPGQPVEMMVLNDALALMNGVLVPTAPRSAMLAVADAAHPAYIIGAAPICEVIDQNGRRQLTAAQYESLISEASSYDLFVDSTITVDGGGHRAGRRAEDGQFREVVLTKHEAGAIIELATTRRALRAGDFKTVSVTAMYKVIERARRKVDVKLGRYEWRAIHTLPGDVPEAKRWRFGPPEGMSWALITGG